MSATLRPGDRVIANSPPWYDVPGVIVRQSPRGPDSWTVKLDGAIWLLAFRTRELTKDEANP